MASESKSFFFVPLSLVHTAEMHKTYSWTLLEWSASRCSNTSPPHLGAPSAAPQQLSSDRSPSMVAASLALNSSPQPLNGPAVPPASRSVFSHRCDLPLPVKVWQSGEDQPVTKSSAGCPRPRQQRPLPLVLLTLPPSPRDPIPATVSSSLSRV